MTWLLHRGALAAWKAARALYGADGMLATAQTDGHRMSVRAFSYADLLSIDDYESRFADWLPPEGGVAIDVGAFIGRQTLNYARACGPHGRVLAIEPLKANFQLLARNVAQNGYEQAVCIPVALGSRDGAGVLSYDRDGSHASLTHSRERQQVVSIRSLDSLCHEHLLPKVDLLRIDTEGNELDVLAGAEETLASNPQLRLILDVRRGSGGMSVARPVRTWLEARGFTCSLVAGDGRLCILAEGAQAAGRVTSRTATVRRAA